MSESDGALIEAAPASAANFVEQGRVVKADRGWEWIASGFALFKQEPLNWIAIGIIAMILFVVVSHIIFFGGFIVTLFTPVLMGGVMLGCRAQEQGAKLEIAHLFAGFKTPRTGKLFMVGFMALVGTVLAYLPALLMMGYAGFMTMMHGDLAAVVGLGITFVLASLVVMALSIPIYMALWFAPALVVLHDMEPVAAMKASFTACLRNTIPFLLYSVILALLCVLAVIPFGLGFLVLAPVVLASIYRGYRDVYFLPA